MRLQSLYIEEYKNIKKQTFDLSKNTGYIALIGLNGSGKSNLIEAVSLIFNGLVNKEIVPFKYELRYEHNGKNYSSKPGLAFIDGTSVPESSMVYPSSVIACYSGEDRRWWHMAFENYYTHYFSQAIKDKISSPQLVYLNKDCWKIAFIALLCSQKGTVNSFFKDCLQIQDLQSIDCRFTSDVEKEEKFRKHQALKWFSRIKKMQEEAPNGLINANTIRTIDMSMYGVKDPQLNCQFVFQFLYLLAIPELNREKGQDVDKLITDINIFINGIEFNSLSEGEKKMILIECITQVLGRDDSIVLLDEPDAHVHIEFKKRLLDAIATFNGQTLLTTHSPVLANHIQKTNKDNIVLLKDGSVVDTTAINKLSAISGEDIDFISSSVVVGSKFILVVEGISDVRCISKAIDIWSSKDSKYQSLKRIKILSSGGTGDAKEIFTDVLFSQIEYIDKIVYLFDIDDAGKKGQKGIEDLKKEPKFIPYAPKIQSIFYGDDLSKNCELEDLFPKDVYQSIIIKQHSFETYRDYKSAPKPIQQIKDYIKEKASTFKDEWFNNFQPVLDKILSSFGI